MSHFTGLSFIICYRDEEDITPTLTSIRDSFAKISSSHPNSNNYEILTVRGNHPSLQRNVAVDEAIYSHIYFLDNDSILNCEGLECLILFLASAEGEKATIIGGPTLLPNSASNFEACVDGILTSYPVIGRRASRYSQAGEMRKSDGTELILCNMVIDKKDFIASGRFDYRLYPNEENEFMGRINKRGGDIVYHPSLSIHRHQRENYTAFIHQMLNYGRGKAEELRIELGRLQLWSLRFFFMLFMAFLLVLLTFGIGSIFQSEASLKWLSWSSNRESLSLAFLGRWLPHLIFWYSVYLVWIGARASVRKKRLLFQLPVLLALGHLVFAMAFYYNLYRTHFKSEEKVFWFKTNCR